MAKPLTVDKWRELQAARRWANRAIGAKDQDDRMRIWRQTIAHLTAHLTGQPPDLHPEQRKLLT